MANWGKTAGIMSGLAVGLSGGVFLAAMNPILPRTDTTKVAQAPMQQTAQDSGVDQGAESVSQESAPKLSLVQQATPSPEPVTALPELSGASDAPVNVGQSSAAPKASDVAGLGAETPLPEETELAMVVPDADAAPQAAVQTLLERDDQAETQPNVSTIPAEPVVLVKPAADTNSPDALTPDVQDIATVAPEVSRDTATPAAFAPTPQMTGARDGVAVMPQVDSEPELRIKAKPEPNLADQPVVVVPDRTDPDAESTATIAALAPQQQANKSGTFQTVGSRLPTIGESGENGISSLGTGGISARIPSIGGQTSEESVQIDEPALGAVWANANNFTPTGKPLMSIVLLDTGDIADQLPKLSGLGLPLAIAIPLDQPDVASKARAYRNAGFEVLGLSPHDVSLSLSGGQTDEQVAELLKKYFTLMPEALGLIDRPDANLQKDQRLVRAVVSYFAGTGHGLITYAGGLNAAPRLADQQNVPSAVVNRVLDGAGESDAVMTGYLNRAARQARSKGQAIVVATPSRATMAALLNWSLSTNARAVTLAPVSAVLIEHGS